MQTIITNGETKLSFVSDEERFTAEDIHEMSKGLKALGVPKSAPIYLAGVRTLYTTF